MEKGKQNDDQKLVGGKFFAKIERDILDNWKKNDTFKKSLEKESPKGEFIFYDGPPFANGLPHYGHILASIIKDAIPRYKTMQGYHVPRKWGWDCHGLPVENEVEKELGLKSKKDIESMGLEKFNEAAEKSVLKYSDNWREFIPRIGRWVDMDEDYRTMDSDYTESIWWIFKTLHDKKLIYEDFKSMHICPRCETTLSNFEVTQGYKDVTDISVYAKFKLNELSNTYLVAWTTTPWTLPGNAALAINPEVKYAKYKNKTENGEEIIIVARDRIKEIPGGENLEEIEEIGAKKLIGMSYTPLFDYYSSDENLRYLDNGWKIYGADFVTTEDGTGIVHIAPAFGMDDFELSKKYSLPFIQHVNQSGKFKEEISDLAGKAVKPKENPQETDIEIIKLLAQKNLLFAKKKITHSYPFCWRCDTPLINYASASWFVNVQEIKDKLLSENKKIKWIPPDIRDGRFGKWLEGARDWAISRSRYWGAPIPVWKCEECNEVIVAGSVDDVRKESKKNRYIVMRHGEADSNVQGIVSGKADNPHHLTLNGKRELEESIEKLKSKEIDQIYTSPFVRTKESAEMVAEGIGFGKENVKEDKRLSEVNSGELNLKTIEEYHDFYPTLESRFSIAPEGGETYRDIRKRMGDFIRDTDEKNEGKTILVITHEVPSWLLFAASEGHGANKTLNDWKSPKEFLHTGEFRELTLHDYPRNSYHEVDFHRPHIDEVELDCSCGGKTKRIPDVFDCWFESGSMPYGSNNYPFSNTDIFDPEKKKGYPANFIAEGLDQTRGWFYSMIVLSVALFGKAAYESVIVNGMILAEDGEKMSKRLKNYPDPGELVENYGADALRLYLFSSPVVHGESLLFSEKGVDEMMKKNLLRLNNVLAFYEMYADDTKASNKSENILDRWIISNLSETANAVSKSLDNYELDRAIRPIVRFIDDLSVWYLRRSRDRFKEGGKEAKLALATLRYILQEISKIMAPFTPFFAEYLFKKVSDGESVHLEDWPKIGDIDSKVLQAMNTVREEVSKGLELRAKSGIKVRQPLASVTLNISLDDEYKPLIKEELNVKEVLFDEGVQIMQIDTEISEELKNEGLSRDLIREIQSLRKEQGFVVDDRPQLKIETSPDLADVIRKYEKGITKISGVEKITFEKIEADKVAKLDGKEVKIRLEK